MINNIEEIKIDSIIKQIENNSVLPKDLAKKLIDVMKSQNSFIENLFSIVRKYEGKNVDMKTLEDALLNFKKQSDMAKIIQESIFPSSLPNNNIVSITAKLFPMNETSGDFYDVIEIIPNSVYGLLLADISGHGVSAALITNLAKILFTNAIEKFASPKDVMSYINTEFCNILHQRTYFTSFYSIIDFPNKQIVYSSAGHPYNIKYNAQNKQLEKLLALDMIVGIVSNRDFKEKKFDISIGDRLILYTDGISEARNSKNEMFGDKRLSDLLLDNIEAPSNELIELIEYKVKKFTQKNYFDDDVTIIVADIKSDKDKDENAASSKAYYSKDETNRLIDYLRKSIKIKEEHNDTEGIIKDLRRLGSNLMGKGKPQEAFEYLERAKKLAIELNDEKQLGGAFFALGNFYYNTGEIEKSIDYLKEGLEHYLSIDDKDGISVSYNNLSIVYDKQGDREKSKECIFKGLEVQKNRPPDLKVMKSIAFYYNNLAITYSEENDHNKALDYYLKSWEIAEQYDILGLQATLLNNIGNSYIINNELDKALKYLLKGLRILEDIEQHDLLATLFQNIALINFYKDEKELAFYNLNKGIKITEKYNIIMKESSLKTERAYHHIKMNQILECLNDLLDSLMINKKLKIDASEGETKIVIGILLYKIGNYLNSSTIKEKYEKMLPFLEGEITPEYFFEKAIEESKSKTIIAGLFTQASYEYAIYLYEKGDEVSCKKAVELLKEAIKVANDCKNLIEKEKIKKVIIELKLEDKFKELW